MADETGTFFESAGKAIKETTNSALEETKVGFKKSTEAISTMYAETKLTFKQNHPSICADFLVEIIPGLYQMPFPDEDLAPRYSKLLNKEYETKYRIWNVSEYSYKTELFNDQVNHYVHVGYPNPPLLEIVLICKEMSNWLEASSENIVVLHCQKSSVRSCLIVGCFLFLKGEALNPSEKMDDVAQVTLSLLETGAI